MFLSINWNLLEHIFTDLWSNDKDILKVGFFMIVSLLHHSIQVCQQTKVQKLKVRYRRWSLNEFLGLFNVSTTSDLTMFTEVYYNDNGLETITILLSSFKTGETTLPLSRCRYYFAVTLLSLINNPGVGFDTMSVVLGELS